MSRKPDVDTAVVSSTLTSLVVSGGHGVAHVVTEGFASLMSPSVMFAGTVVFATTWGMSYAGMRDKLPF